MIINLVIIISLVIIQILVIKENCSSTPTLALRAEAQKKTLYKDSSCMYDLENDTRSPIRFEQTSATAK